MMRRITRRIVAILATLLATGLGATAHAQPGSNPLSKDGSAADANFFPLAVWLQSPSNAQAYKKAGINTYVALWNGPTQAQLAELDQHGMRVICDHNKVALAHANSSTIIAWMHGDEPDNAQSLGEGKGYGPPILPAKIVEDYKKLKFADPSRPVLLNLGQGVVWDHWYGRGARTNHPEDYREYIKGSDIVSFDIYPACHDHKDVAGKLWMVADGVTRLREWSGDKKPAWACIETTRISNEKAIVTPAPVRAEVWMALVRGARGIIYFCHQFKPRFIEAGLLAEREILAAVTKTNHQIRRLAPVLNAPTLEGVLSVESPEGKPIEATCKRVGTTTYVFAVAMRGVETTATFRVRGTRDGSAVQVIDEGRAITSRNEKFTDEFPAWGVRLYQIDPRR